MQCLHMEQRMGQFEGFSLSWPVLVLEDGSSRLNSTMWSGAAHMGKCSPSSHSLQQNCRGPSLLLAVEQTMGKNKDLSHLVPRWQAEQSSASSPTSRRLMPSQPPCSSTSIQPCHGVPPSTLTHGAVSLGLPGPSLLWG